MPARRCWRWALPACSTCGRISSNAVGRELSGASRNRAVLRTTAERVGPLRSHRGDRTMASPALLPTPPSTRSLASFLLPTAAGLGVALLWLTYHVVPPLFATARSSDTETVRIVLPAYDYQPWHALPVQAGRTKPFETACADAVRQITSKSRFEGQDPVAVVLAWMLAGDADAGTTDWENYPFILCEHHGLRRQIYASRTAAGQELTDAQQTARYISPADLRQSSDFDNLLKSAAQARKEFRDKAHVHMSPEELKAEEVGRRLVQYDAL